MNFGSWTDRLREAAAEAIPLKGLDEMAAEDTYVQSEGLNVVRDAENDDDDDDDDDDNNEMVPLTEGAEHRGEQKKDKHLPLHAVSDMTVGFFNSKENRSNDRQAHHVRFDLEENALDDQRRTTPSSMGVLEMEMSESSDHGETEPVRPKQKHRFLEDLDNRLAQKNVPTSRSSSVTATLSSSNSNKNQNGSSSSSSRSWLFGLGGAGNKSNNNSEPPPPDNGRGKDAANDDNNDDSPLPPLSRQRIHPKSSKANPAAEEYATVTSAGMLDADDLLALEQMKHLNESQDSTVTKLKEMIQGHPRESFIVLTLFLGAGVYFFQRHVSNEDDVV